jgi:pyruvate dehydrogenase E1 component
MNENYDMPILPLGSSEGICRGIYKLSSRDLGPGRPKVQLFGTGAILRESLRAQDLLERNFGIGSNVYSVTSYKSLCDDGRACSRWNRLHPGESPKVPYVTQTLTGESGPVVAALDYVSAVGLSISPWVMEREADKRISISSYTVLGTDGFGRSDGRPELRRFFEVDAENIAMAAIAAAVRDGQYPRENLSDAIESLGLDSKKPNPVET